MQLCFRFLSFLRYLVYNLFVFLLDFTFLILNSVALVSQKCNNFPYSILGKTYLLFSLIDIFYTFVCTEGFLLFVFFFFFFLLYSFSLIFSGFIFFLGGANLLLNLFHSYFFSKKFPPKINCSLSIYLFKFLSLSTF